MSANHKLLGDMYNDRQDVTTVRVHAALIFLAFIAQSFYLISIREIRQNMSISSGQYFLQFTLVRIQIRFASFLEAAEVEDGVFRIHPQLKNLQARNLAHIWGGDISPNQTHMIAWKT